jgi:hypothetical protein
MNPGNPRPVVRKSSSTSVWGLRDTPVLGYSAHELNHAIEHREADRALSTPWGVRIRPPRGSERRCYAWQEPGDFIQRRQHARAKHRAHGGFADEYLQHGTLVEHTKLQRRTANGQFRRDGLHRGGDDVTRDWR